MVVYQAKIERFQKQGEKTGWTYIQVSWDIAEQLMPGNKKSFRVKGKLDDCAFEGVALLPIGEGNFIMALNLKVRKSLQKAEGEHVRVEIELDTREKLLNADLLECLNDEPRALLFFNSLPKSHQKYFSNWIDSAKTDETKARRIAQAVNALAMQMGFREMVRANKKA